MLIDDQEPSPSLKITVLFETSKTPVKSPKVPSEQCKKGFDLSNRLFGESPTKRPKKESKLKSKALARENSNKPMRKNSTERDASVKSSKDKSQRRGSKHKIIVKDKDHKLEWKPPKDDSTKQTGALKGFRIPKKNAERKASHHSSVTDKNVTPWNLDSASPKKEITRQYDSLKSFKIPKRSSQSKGSSLHPSPAKKPKLHDTRVTSPECEPTGLPSPLRSFKIPKLSSKNVDVHTCDVTNNSNQHVHDISISNQNDKSNSSEKLSENKDGSTNVTIPKTLATKTSDVTPQNLATETGDATPKNLENKVCDDALKPPSNRVCKEDKKAAKIKKLKEALKNLDRQIEVNRALKRLSEGAKLKEISGKGLSLTENVTLKEIKEMVERSPDKIVAKKSALSITSAISKPDSPTMSIESSEAELQSSRKHGNKGGRETTSLGVSDQQQAQKDKCHKRKRPEELPRQDQNLIDIKTDMQASACDNLTDNVDKDTKNSVKLLPCDKQDLVVYDKMTTQSGNNLEAKSKTETTKDSRKLTVVVSDTSALDITTDMSFMDNEKSISPSKTLKVDVSDFTALDIATDMSFMDHDKSISPNTSACNELTSDRTGGSNVASSVHEPVQKTDVEGVAADQSRTTDIDQMTRLDKVTDTNTTNSISLIPDAKTELLGQLSSEISKTHRHDSVTTKKAAAEETAVSSGTYDGFSLDSEADIGKSDTIITTDHEDTIDVNGVKGLSKEHVSSEDLGQSEKSLIDVKVLPNIARPPPVDVTSLFKTATKASESMGSVFKGPWGPLNTPIHLTKAQSSPAITQRPATPTSTLSDSITESGKKKQIPENLLNLFETAAKASKAISPLFRSHSTPSIAVTTDPPTTNVATGSAVGSQKVKQLPKDVANLFGTATKASENLSPRFTNQPTTAVNTSAAPFFALLIQKWYWKTS